MLIGAKMTKIHLIYLVGIKCIHFNGNIYHLYFNSKPHFESATRAR